MAPQHDGERKEAGGILDVLHGALGHRHEQPAAPAPKEPEGFFDKLKHLAGQEPEPAPAPPPPPAEPEGLVEKLMRLGHASEEPAASAPPPPPPKGEEGLFDKLRHHGHVEDAAPVAKPPKEREERGEGGLFGGLAHHFEQGGRREDEQDKGEGKTKIHGHGKEEARKEEGILGEIEERLKHGGHSAPPPKPEGFFAQVGDKLNNMAGGGAKGEANEDHLDKTIDWVQEHVLKAGQQKDESAIEQAKDEQISDFIRKGFKGATGHELPVKDK